MSNKVEAAVHRLTETELEADRNAAEARLAEPANTFTDHDGDTFEAVQGGVEGWDLIDLTVTYNGSANVDANLSFFKADATKIIALIAEAAK